MRITYTWHGAAAAAGVGILSDIPDDALLTHLPEFVDYQGGALEYDQYCQALAGYLGTSADEAGKIHRHIVVEPYPDTLDIVEDLIANGITVGCLSNTNEPHWREMLDSGRFPAIERLQVKVASHEVGTQKPDKGIFDAYLALSRTRPVETLLFDDTGVNVEAAASYGWKTFLIDPSGPTAPQIREGLKDHGLELPAHLPGW